jgi:hypothetical protein
MQGDLTTTLELLSEPRFSSLLPSDEKLSAVAASDQVRRGPWFCTDQVRRGPGFCTDQVRRGPWFCTDQVRRGPWFCMQGQVSKDRPFGFALQSASSVSVRLAVCFC